MPHAQPSRAGFKAVIRRPATIFAEVTWRWAFGLASLSLLALTFVLFLRTIRVSDAEIESAKSGSPYLVANVIQHLLNANKAPLLYAVAVLVPGIAILWTIAASIGRLVTLPPILRLIRESNEVARSGDPVPKPEVGAASDGRISMAPNFRSLLAISFFRAALTLALIGAYFGSAFAAGFVAAGVGDSDSSLAAFFVVFLPLFLLAVLIYGFVNWLLGIAPIFAVRDGASTFAAISATGRLLNQNRRDSTAIGTAYGLAKFVALVIVTVISVMIAVSAAAVPKLAIVLVIVISLAYFVFADLMYLARLASYAALAEPDPEPLAKTPISEPAISRF